MQKGFHTQRGMTLVEVIIVSTLFSLIMFAIGESIASLYRSNAYNIAQSFQVQHARKGVQALVRDVREMTYANDGTFPLSDMQEHQIGFFSDIDRDSSVEYVEYELTANTLTKRVYNAAGSPATYNTSSPDETYILSEYVQNQDYGTSTFYYFDENGNEATATSTVTDIRFIRVQSIINVDPVRDPGQFMLRSSATLRNVN